MTSQEIIGDYFQRNCDIVTNILTYCQIYGTVILKWRALSVRYINSRKWVCL